MTPTAKQQLEDLLNDALDEQRRLAIKKVEGILDKVREKRIEWLKKERNLKEDLRVSNINYVYISFINRQLELINAYKEAYLDVINLLEKELSTL